VVIGSDPTLEGARGEVAWAAKNGIPDAKLFRRNGFFATIALADDRAQAAQLLDVAKKRRASAYLTNLARWCKSRTDKDGYTDCASP
jgi:hypothetical protein